MGMAGPLQAQIAPAPCDPKYMQSLEARAWLEAQREITQNQNLIVKPDSVMEYSCFDRYLGALVQSAPAMFSQSNRWGEPYGNMSNALTVLVGRAYKSYWEQNFQHPELGGRANFSAAVLNADPVDAVSYQCGIMKEVWKQAKCMDFIQDPDTDGFYTFEQYRDSRDKRQRPERCTEDPRWTENIRSAYGSATPWAHDNVDTFFDALEGGGDPIPTGVIVERPKQSPTRYLEHICIAPGYHYVPSSEDGGDCVAN